MLDFLGEMVVEGIFGPLFSVLGWLLKMLFYVPLLGLGWLCRWWPLRQQLGLGQVWQQHGRAGMHQAGWRATVLVAQYIMVLVLILPLLALAGWFFVHYA